MDLSGNSYNDDGELVYLCAACCQWTIKRLIKEVPDEDNAKLLAWIKDRRNRLAKADVR